MTINMNASNEEKVMKDFNFKQGDYVVVKGMSDQEQKDVQEFLESVGTEFQYKSSKIKGQLCEYYFSYGCWNRSSTELTGGTNRTEEVLSAMKASKAPKEYKYKIERKFGSVATVFGKKILTIGGKSSDEFFVLENNRHIRVSQEFFDECGLPEYIVEQTTTPVRPEVDLVKLHRIEELEKELAQLKSEV